MSSVPKNKTELQNAITVAFDKILVDYSTIPAVISRKKAIVGNVKNTEISVGDTVAYLIGWGKLVLKWHAKKSQGLAVDFPETGYKWNELGQLAQSFHKEYQEWAYETLLEEFKVTITNILTLIESLDNQKLYGEPWFEKYTLGKMIQFNTSSPMSNMRSKVRKFKKINNI
ncbi:MAG: ClbS/DfsB family four-helix bundle protein [Colwellia sp.]|nr:ClbS/DfsB family four-helix bundle protein [Colwellia sp.]